MPLLRREYLLSAVQWLKNGPKMEHITQRDFSNLNCFHRHQLVWQRCCCSALNSVSPHLACCLPKVPLKGVFLDIYLTTFFGVRNFKNTSGMRIIFFLKLWKIQSEFRKQKKKKAEKVFLFWENCIWKCCNKLALSRKEYL